MAAKGLVSLFDGTLHSRNVGRINWGKCLVVGYAWQRLLNKQDAAIQMKLRVKKSCLNHAIRVTTESLKITSGMNFFALPVIEN